MKIENENYIVDIPDITEEDLKVKLCDELSKKARYVEIVKKLNKKSIDKFILDENKNAVSASLMEWANFFENTKQRIVKQEEIGQYFVSTVFLGIDHGYYYARDKDYKPLIFETMVFDSMKDKSREEYYEQYSTWKEAEEGHARAVQWVIDGCKKEDDE